MSAHLMSPEEFERAIISRLTWAKTLQASGLRREAMQLVDEADDLTRLLNNALAFNYDTGLFGAGSR